MSRNIAQRRGYVDDPSQNAELNEIYKATNAFQKDKKIFANYTASFQDRRVSFMNRGLTLTLPAIHKEADGYIIFISDKSGEASLANQTVQANTGKQIGTTSGLVSSIIMSSNYGFLELQWDQLKDTWYQIR